MAASGLGRTLDNLPVATHTSELLVSALKDVREELDLRTERLATALSVPDKVLVELQAPDRRGLGRQTAASLARAPRSRRPFPDGLSTRPGRCSVPGPVGPSQGPDCGPAGGRAQHTTLRLAAVPLPESGSKVERAYAQRRIRQPPGMPSLLVLVQSGSLRGRSARRRSTPLAVTPTRWSLCTRTSHLAERRRCLMAKAARRARCEIPPFSKNMAPSRPRRDESGRSSSGNPVASPAHVTVSAR
jgi:hypothetical protein